MNIILGIVQIYTGGIVALICIPLLRGNFSMNRYYGFRFKRAFESEAAWTAVNRYGAGWTITWSVLLIAFGILLLFVPLRHGEPLFWCSLATPLVLIIPAAQTYAFARGLPRDGDADTGARES